MILEGLNKDEFHVLWIAKSEQPYCDFAVILGHESSQQMSVALHVSREELGEINGLIAHSDRMAEKQFH